MSADAKIRIGAAILVAGELGALWTQHWARAATFVGYVGVAGVVVIGAFLATWGVVQIGQRS